MTEQPRQPGPKQTKPESAASRLFAIRELIAAMFVIYGIVLIIVGLVDSKSAVHKAAGVRINLWTGIGMLAMGLFFAAWVWLRPLTREATKPSADPTLREVQEEQPPI